MTEVMKVEAHDSEVLCLEYSKPETGKLQSLNMCFAVIYSAVHSWDIGMEVEKT